MILNILNQAGFHLSIMIFRPKTRNLQWQETQVTKLFAFSWKTNMLQLWFGFLVGWSDHGLHHVPLFRCHLEGKSTIQQVKVKTFLSLLNSPAKERNSPPSNVTVSAFIQLQRSQVRFTGKGQVMSPSIIWAEKGGQVGNLLYLSKSSLSNQHFTLASSAHSSSIRPLVSGPS